MDENTRGLRRELKRAGLSDRAIDAAWPAWWSDEASASRSAQAELRLTLARNLGLAPKSLIGDRVEFIWHGPARFKHLTIESAAKLEALRSFGLVIGRLALLATPRGDGFGDAQASQLRSALLSGRQFVDLSSLLALCWAVGVPVLHLRVFPLTSKAMHAMVIQVDGRHAVLLGRDANYPAPIAFSLAHEIGHLVLRHLGDANALVDFGDPSEGRDGDADEEAADRFALEILTGSATPDIRTNIPNPSARALAAAVLSAGPPRGIEPGTLALCMAYRTGAWAAAVSALPHIYRGEARPVWRVVNRLAATEMDIAKISPDSRDYLDRVLQLQDV